MFTGFRRVLFGDPLPTASEEEQRLTKIKALAVFSSDALSSVAYATEEILLVLVAAGTAYLGLSIPIALAIALLAIVVAISYYQTVHGYPSGGGAYVVAEENLGKWPGLIAAAALLIGYVLTVSVSIAAGVEAVTSALPALFPYRVELCLAAIALIAWANLRGIKESGTIFAIPTYGFILILLALIAVGTFRMTVSSLSPVSIGAVLPEGIPRPVGPYLLLRAFASGCAALTGIEAISNGVPAFRKPEARNAGITLIAMAVLLGCMFLGVTFLASSLGVVPERGQTVVSQIGRRVFGGGLFYLFLQAATTLILVLAANTSFVSFPRLSAILAQSRYLPNQLTGLGDRLVFNNGIFALALERGLQQRQHHRDPDLRRQRLREADLGRGYLLSSLHPRRGAPGGDQGPRYGRYQYPEDRAHRSPRQRGGNTERLGCARRQRELRGLRPTPRPERLDRRYHQ